MKFATTAILLSGALATLAAAAPVVIQSSEKSNFLNKRCADCTHTDGVALELVVKVSAVHYSNIAYTHLDNLMTKIQTTKIASSNMSMIQEETMLSDAAQSNINEAKQACAPENLASAIKATVSTDATFDIPWSKKEEIEKKMTELDVKITKMMLDRIQTSVNAELLSKDCTEKMTNTVIVPAPAKAPAQASVQPAPVEPVPKPAQAESLAPSDIEAGVNVATDVDTKFVCMSGCKDSNDAKAVLTLRVNLENEFKTRLNQFYQQEVPTACTEKRQALLGGVLNIVADLNTKV